LGLVRRARPDVIFVDLGLPDIEGHDLIRQLRSMSGMEDVKIFVVSPRAMPLPSPPRTPRARWSTSSSP